MVGVLELEERRGHKPVLTQERLLDLRVLRASVPVSQRLRETKRLRRVERGGEALYCGGVRRVLTPVGFPDWDTLKRIGLRPVDPVPLCQAMAGLLAFAALNRAQKVPTQATVALSGPKVTRSLARAAEELCPRVRYLAVEVPEGGEELADWLRKEYGAAVLRPGSGPAPDVALCFGPGWRGGGTVLHLYGTKPDLAGLRPEPREQSLPATLDQMALMALLWEEGRLPLEQIQVYNG